MGDQLAPQEVGFDVNRDGGAPPFHAETFADGVAGPPARDRSHDAFTLRVGTREDLFATDVLEDRPADVGANRSFFAALTPTASPAPANDVRIPTPEPACDTPANVTTASDPDDPLRVPLTARAGQPLAKRRASLSARRGLLAGTIAALALTVVTVAAAPGASAPPDASASATEAAIAVVRPVEIQTPAPTVVVRKTVVRRIVRPKAAPAPATLPASSPSPRPAPAAKAAPPPAPRVSRPPPATPRRSDEPSSFGGEFSP